MSIRTHFSLQALLVGFSIHRQCPNRANFFLFTTQFSLYVCISLILFCFVLFHVMSCVQLFLSCLEAIQSHRILMDIDQSKLFSNIREICEVNIKFWTLYLYPMVSDCTDDGDESCMEKYAFRIYHI